MSLYWGLFGDFSEHVVSFLDAQHLGRMEAASKAIDRAVTEPCWETLAWMERETLEWRPRLLQIIPQGATGKEALRELYELRRYLNTVPANWSPQITSLGPSCLQVAPSDLSADANAAEDGLAASPVPPWAAVPLALGITLGDEMSAGIQIQSEAGCVNEGVWLGVEFTGIDEGWGKCMSVLCAPLTGRCMMKFPGEDHGLVAQAFDPLVDVHADSVKLYVTVSESGDVEFIRFCQAANSVVRSGRMPRNMFPCWTKEMFVVINIQTEAVHAKSRVTNCPISWELQDAKQQPEFEFDGVWSFDE